MWLCGVALWSDRPPRWQAQGHQAVSEALTTHQFSVDMNYHGCWWVPQTTACASCAYPMSSSTLLLLPAHSPAPLLLPPAHSPAWVSPHGLIDCRALVDIGGHDHEHMDKVHRWGHVGGGIQGAWKSRHVGEHMRMTSKGAHEAGHETGRGTQQLWAGLMPVWAGLLPAAHRCCRS